MIESCFATHYARFALGKQQLDEIDRNYVSHLAEQLTASDGIVKKWLVSLVSDPAFGLRRDALEEK